MVLEKAMLRDINAKYFDNGLKGNLANDYSTTELIMALSILQNGSIPRFVKEDHLQALFLFLPKSHQALASQSFKLVLKTWGFIK